MSPEMGSNIIFDQMIVRNARVNDLRGHFEAYLEGIRIAEGQKGKKARAAQRIFTARAYEIEEEMVRLFLTGDSKNQQC